MNKIGIRKRIATIAVTVCVCVLAMTGCATFEGFKYTFIDKPEKSDNVIYIGVFEPKSGDLSVQGMEELKGIQLANKIYNNVKGYKVELIVVDNQSNPESAKTAIQSLIDQQPVMIIGSVGESNSMIASKFVKKAGIPSITPSATNPLITQDNPYFFRACITDTQRGAGLALYAYEEINSRNIALITIKNDNTTKTLADGFEDKIDNLDGTTDAICMKAVLDVEDTEMPYLVNRIKSSKADVVFMPVGLEKADAIFKMIEKTGMEEDITFLGDPSWEEPEFVKMMDKHKSIKVVFPSDQVLNENMSTTNTVTAETQRFLIKYTETYGEDDLPTEHTSLGYDSYLIAINAINNAADIDHASVLKALNEIENLRCTTGIFTFDENGNPVRTVNIATIEKGLVINAYKTGDVVEAGEMKKIERN